MFADLGAVGAGREEVKTLWRLNWRGKMYLRRVREEEGGREGGGVEEMMGRGDGWRRERIS